ncbi:hypothetical protein SAMN06265379_11415 [Saccharicrinis carchari]|uniref:Uncharacterized protein n=1 Tax=Saccharicrinis carchari TaxID=1168039 RepID=A0A521F584_SACCC|nr:hypothetical protein SAMN06265379_11415 [Saccharicrinis carchari]
MGGFIFNEFWQGSQRKISFYSLDFKKIEESRGYQF